MATEIKNKAERLALQLSAHELDVSSYVLLIWHGILLWKKSDVTNISDYTLEHILYVWDVFQGFFLKWV